MKSKQDKQQPHQQRRSSRVSFASENHPSSSTTRPVSAPSHQPKGVLINKNETNDLQLFAHIDHAFRPLLDSLKSQTTKSFKDFCNEEKLENLNMHLSDFMKDLNQSIEYSIYDMLRFSMEFVLTDKTEIDISAHPNQQAKNKAQMYLSQLKQHFHTSKMHFSLKQLFKKLDKKTQPRRRSALEDSDEEGFFDSNHHVPSTKSQEPHVPMKTSSASSIASKETLVKAQTESMKNLFKMEASQLSLRINDLESSLKQRDDYIEDLTRGYIKDIGHLKEMMFRKSNNDQGEYFEVQYFDGTSGLDEQIQAMLNDRLRGLKHQCEVRTKEFSRKIIFLNHENEKLNKRLAELLPMEPDTSDLLKRVFKEEENPYVLWKLIQEFKGNQFFFDVFEKQKPEYGINYKEVNVMLASKKVYENEYSLYKAQNDEQLCELIAKTKKCTDEVRAESEEKDEEIRRLQIELESFSENKTKKLMERIKTYWDDKEYQLIAKLRKDQQEFMEGFNDTRDAMKLKQMYQRWAFSSIMVKYTRLEDSKRPSIIQAIKRVLFSGNAREAELAEEEKIAYLERKVKIAEDEKAAAEKELGESVLKTILLNEHIESAAQDRVLARTRAEQLSQQLVKTKEDLLRSETNAGFMKKLIDNIMKHLGMRLDEQQFQVSELHVEGVNLTDLEDDTKVSTKAFRQRISKLSNNMLRKVREEVVLGEKVIDTTAELFKREVETKEVMTDIMNVDWQILDYVTLSRRMTEQREMLTIEFQEQVEKMIASGKIGGGGGGAASKERQSSARRSSRSQHGRNSVRLSEKKRDSIQSEKSQFSKPQTTTEQAAMAATDGGAIKTIVDNAVSTTDFADYQIPRLQNEAIRAVVRITYESTEPQPLLQQHQLGNESQEGDQSQQQSQELSSQQAQQITELTAQNTSLQENIHKLEEEIAQLKEGLSKIPSKTDLSLPQTNNQLNAAAVATAAAGGQPQSSSHQPPLSPNPKHFSNKTLDASHSSAYSKRTQSLKQDKLHRKVFDRLFLDSKEKSIRLEELKKQLATMESFQWEEVLSMIHLLQNNNDSLKNQDQVYLQSINPQEFTSSRNHFNQSIEDFPVSSRVSGPAAALAEYHLTSLKQQQQNQQQLLLQQQQYSLPLPRILNSARSGGSSSSCSNNRPEYFSRTKNSSIMTPSQQYNSGRSTSRHEKLNLNDSTGQKQRRETNQQPNLQNQQKPRTKVVDFREEDVIQHYILERGNQRENNNLDESSELNTSTHNNPSTAIKQMSYTNAFQTRNHSSESQRLSISARSKYSSPVSETKKQQQQQQRRTVINISDLQKMRHPEEQEHHQTTLDKTRQSIPGTIFVPNTISALIKPGKTASTMTGAEQLEQTKQMAQADIQKVS